MSITVQPIEADNALTPDERDLIADAQADVLATVLRHPLDLAGDIAVLSAVVDYLAKAHGMPAEALMRAAAPKAGIDRGLH